MLLLGIPLLQWEVIRLIRRGRPVAHWIQMSPSLKSHLGWWLNPRRYSEGVLFQPPPVQEVVFTDASMTGWGVVFRDQSWSGKWLRPHQISLAFYWRQAVGCEIPDDDQVLADLIRSFKREKPIPSRHVAEWDIDLVLEFYK